MVSVPQLASHISTSALPRELGGVLEVDHKAWLIHCLKSTANRYGDLCDLSPLPLTTTSSTLGSEAEAGKDGLVPQLSNGLSKLLSVETETDESELQFSLHEKQNYEDREKEVEVIKDKKNLNEVMRNTKFQTDSLILNKHSFSVNYKF